MDNQRTDILFHKCVTGTATAEERREFLLLMESDETGARRYIGESFQLEGNESVSSDENTALIFESIVNAEQRVVTPVHRMSSLSGDKPSLKTAWVKYAAAILIIAGIGAYLWNIQQKKNPVITETKPAPVKNDIMPGKDRAVLTLSNGEQVQLDHAAAETIKDGTLSIENKNGQLIYKKGDLVALNTMSTPKGGQYQLTLADGTKVWLNAASSITYPTAFTGNNRTVKITGEAYFEVAKNVSKPFIVQTYKEEIQVLGTQFNVNAYPDEPVLKTSLAEGSVRIGNNILQPGQAYVNGSITSTNIAQDLAWKNGFFAFKDADIKTVMRQLSRWYDVEVKYTDEIPSDEFSGEIGRSLTLSQVMKILAKVRINFRIENNVITILPEKK